MTTVQDKFAGRWFYCMLCGTPAVKFPCCGNSTCNGSGCDKCRQEHEEIEAAIDYTRPTLQVVRSMPVYQCSWHKTEYALWLAEERYGADAIY